MMFKNNKYTKLYFKLIDVYKGYNGEIHHIIPKSLGGSNKIENLVEIPHRVHFILHKLLVNMLDGDNRQKMIYAIWMMSNSNRYKITSREYEKIRLEYQQIMILDNPMKRKDVISKRKGQKRSNESKERMKIASRNRWEREGKLKPIFTKICNFCENDFETKNIDQKSCSIDCKLEYYKFKRELKKNLLNQKNKKDRIPWNKGKVGIYSETTLKKMSDSKTGTPAWNKGLSSPHSANNGIKGAKKQSNTVKGRKISIDEYGKRTWIYPNSE